MYSLTKQNMCNRLKNNIIEYYRKGGGIVNETERICIS